jgi:ParB family chromosome partitioning protein
VTKDRRLGRGLAALLGTPLDESNIVDGSLADGREAGPPPTRFQARVATPDQTLNHPPALSDSTTSQPSSNFKSAGETAQNAVATGQNSPAPRSPARVRQSIASNPASGVTGSVPLTSVFPSPGQAMASESTQNASNGGSPAITESHSVAKAAPASPPAQAALEIDVDLIDANPFQPRRQFNEEEIASLAESIKEHQQLQPVLVRKVGSRYQLISGERRLRATIHAGLQKVRAEVREADDRLVAELAIVENLQRKDLNPIEKALSFRRYLDEHSCTQDELAKRLKIDRSTIANLMRLLELPTPILEAVQNDKLSAGHARALLPLGEESQQLSMARQIQAEAWSVRQTEHAVTEILAAEDGKEADKPGKGKRSSARTVTPQIGSLEQELRRSLGTKIEIRQSARGRGKIVVHFNSAEEFDRIREILVPGKERAAA